MKNLAIAALLAAQIMEKWSIYCSTQSDVVWGAFGIFYLVLILLHQWDKYTERKMRMQRQVKMIERASNRGEWR